MALEASELILNDDGSIYHLNLRPEHLADTVITVGDPDRVDRVTAFFDEVEFKIQKREFHTQTGTYKGKRLTVISSGIGADNIDIVLNELDALVNINLEKRTFKEKLKQLTIVRIGTSGSLQANTPVDSFVVSKAAVGFDSLLHYYKHDVLDNKPFTQKLRKHLELAPEHSEPYYVSADKDLFKQLNSSKTVSGITGTNVGFYAPQGRILRAKPINTDLVDKIAGFECGGETITNMEMESSAIFGLAKILGHKAVSTNAIIANRAKGTFSKNPVQLINNLIEYVLDKLVE